MNGHIVCNSHYKDEEEQIIVEEKKDALLKYLDNEWATKHYKEAIDKLNTLKGQKLEDYIDENCESFMNDIEAEGLLPERLCPICSYKDIPDNELVKYLLKNTTRQVIIKEIKERYFKYSDFLEDINKWKLQQKEYVLMLVW